MDVNSLLMGASVGCSWMHDQQKKIYVQLQKYIVVVIIKKYSPEHHCPSLTDGCVQPTEGYISGLFLDIHDQQKIYVQLQKYIVVVIIKKCSPEHHCPSLTDGCEQPTDGCISGLFLDA
ncbi:hypothetical protein CDAR_228921 [Caerostris darwini]|uniref:Uncharacterized protein n=1 Tax=Caerostris darwini TaxID=1538125 RepID=A0AAV4VPP9_9ARAC|nr:hypothetical protein CDAR_228921 [Caerostris darwini]